MDQSSSAPATLASVAFHAFVILGALGVVSTAFQGITRWTTYAALLLWLAGALTFVYPHVGTDPRYARWSWGTPRRSALPWFLMGVLLLICLVRVRF
jgi:hypothetical protein